MSPEERVRNAQIAAHTSWGKTIDRSARTAPARRGLLDKFLAEVPAEITDPRARQAAAENLRKAFYLKLAQRSAEARRAKAAKKRPKSRGAEGAA